MIRLLYQFPVCLQRLYRGVVWRQGGASNQVYLTFDDGPIPEMTPQILDILQQYGVKATFFIVGDNAQRYPTIYQRIMAEGHAVGNHTMHHLKGWRTSTDDYLQDVAQADALLHTRLFRPPYGRMRYRQKRALLRAGYTIYLWDVLAHDYNAHYSTDKMLRIMQRYTRAGSILNFHDSLKSGTRLLQLLPMLIEWLLSQGYIISRLDTD